MEVNVVSIELQCRICLEIQSSEGEMTSLFELMEGDFALSDILKNISNIEVEASENLPGNVCSTCLRTIVNFHNLLLQFQESEDFLRKTYQNQSINGHNEINQIVVVPTSKNAGLDPDENYGYGTQMLSENDHEETMSCSPVGEDIENVVTDPDNYNSSNGIDNIECANVKKESENQDETNIQDKTDSFFQQTDLTEKIISQTRNEIVTETLKFSCEQCGDSFLLKIGFNQHMLQKHNMHLKDADYAKYCSKVIVKKPKSFPNLIKVTRTISCKTEDTQCRICKELFNNESDLKEHMNVHKTHICPICGAAFLKKYYLKDHIVIHSSHRNYVCHICNASFRHRHGLNAHKNSHKTFRDHTCETCGHSFKDKGTLRVHIKLKHNDDRNYTCSECHATFKLKSFLDQHFKRKHTERTKDFVCTVCGVAYLNRTTLLRHLKDKHSGKKPKHICAVCNKSFGARLNLNKHLETIHRISVIK